MSLIAQREEKIVTLDGQTDGQDQAMLRTYTGICTGNRFFNVPVV